MKRFARIVAALAMALPCAALAAPRVPVAIYHFQSFWNGRPISPQLSGWHALAPEVASMGPDTGVIAFLSYWHADRQCWGSERDCRPASWAVQQHLSYIGPVTGAASHISVERKQ